MIYFGQKRPSSGK